MKPNQTQLEKIRKHLKEHLTITSWTAISFYRITRLSEYIRILRHDEGLDITGKRIYPPKSNWYNLYTLNE